tara:strand:+ start:4377 stop:5372 length:996 start_codon:yes stop_codon:yes gene_type:complete
MQLNGETLVDRFNRPSVGGKVAVRTLFINDGKFIDPYDVSACTIFAKLSNASPSSIVDVDDGLIKSDATSVVLMNFEISGDPNNVTTDSGAHTGVDPYVTSKRMLPPTADHPQWNPAYVPGPQASGIYRVGVGDYVAVLDGDVGLSGGYNIRYPFNGGITVANTASSVQDYIDVWTVKLSVDSEYQLFINNFSLYNDTFTTITEPLLITTRNRLLNKKLRYGEKVDLKITTDITVQNSTLPEETKNILKDYPITNPKIMVKKVNDDSVNQEAWTPRWGVDQDATTTTDNTILYSFDTDDAGNLGVGTFFIVAKYSYLTQDYVTPPYYFTIT